MNLTLDLVERIFAEPMTSSAKLVYMAIVYHANVATGKAWPSRALLAKETGLCVNTVSRAVSELCQRSLVECRKSQSGNRYAVRNLVFPSPADGLPETNRWTSDDQQMVAEHKKEHKNKLKKEPIYGDDPFEEFWKASALRLCG